MTKLSQIDRIIQITFITGDTIEFFDGEDTPFDGFHQDGFFIVSTKDAVYHFNKSQIFAISFFSLSEED